MAAVATETKNTLTGLATGDSEALDGLIGLRETLREGSRLDGRTFSLVKIATLIALDAAPASYVWQIANALEEGVEPEELLDVLIAVAPQVGGPRVMAAASEIMLALGLTLPEGV